MARRFLDLSVAVDAFLFFGRPIVYALRNISNAHIQKRNSIVAKMSTSESAWRPAQWDTENIENDTQSRKCSF